MDREYNSLRRQVVVHTWAGVTHAHNWSKSMGQIPGIIFLTHVKTVTSNDHKVPTWYFISNTKFPAHKSKYRKICCDVNIKTYAIDNGYSSPRHEMATKKGRASQRAGD